MTSSGKASWFVGYIAAHNLAASPDDVIHLFTDVKGDNPSPHAGEDADNYRFLIEGTAATYGITAPLTDVSERTVARAAAAIHRARETGVPGLDGPDVLSQYAQYLHLRDEVSPLIPGLVWLNEGRDIFGVFSDDKFLGNSRLANCSKFLKQKPARDWLEANCGPDDTIIYVGIDVDEIARLPDVVAAYTHPFGVACKRPRPCRLAAPCSPDNPCRKHRPCTNEDACAKRLEKPWRVDAPLCWTGDPFGTGRERPYWTSRDITEALTRLDIQPPRMYGDNFQHANCGGGCVRAGHEQFEHLLVIDPDRYGYWEHQEQVLRDQLGKDVSILKDRSNLAPGEPARPLTLRAFREKLETQPSLFEPWTFISSGSGCASCFIDVVDDEAEATA